MTSARGAFHKLEKRRPNGRFFLGPAGSYLGYAQLLSFSFWGMAAWRAVPSPPPTLVFPSVIKAIGTLENRNCSWEESWSSECPYGCQEQLIFLCLFQKMSFNPSRYHLSSTSGIRSLEEREGSWEESCCSGRPHGCQEQFFFSVPIRKYPWTHQDSTCHPSLELDPWRTGRVSDRSLHFNVSNNW